MAVIRSTSRSVLAGLVAVAGLALAGCAAGQIAQTAQQSPTVDGANVQLGSIAVRNVALEYPTQGSYSKGSDARLRMVVANEGTSSDVLTEVRSSAASGATISAAAAGAATGPTPTLTAPPPSDQPTGTASGTPTGTREPQSPSASAGTGQPSGGATGTETPSGSASGSSSASGSATASGSASATPAETEAPAATVTIPANGLISFTGDGPTVELTGLTSQLYPAQPLSVTLVFQKAGQITFAIAVSAPEGQISLAPTVTAATDGSEG